MSDAIYNQPPKSTYQRREYRPVQRQEGKAPAEQDGAATARTKPTY